MESNQIGVKSVANLLRPVLLLEEEAGSHRLLAEGDQVGRFWEVEVLVCPPSACGSEASLHFVHDERHVVLKETNNHFDLLPF